MKPATKERVERALRFAAKTGVTIVSFLWYNVFIAVLNTRTVANVATAVAVVLTLFACFWYAFTGNVIIFDKLPIIGQYLATYVPPRVDRVSVQRVPAVVPKTSQQTAAPTPSQQKTEDLPEVLRVDDDLVKYAALAAVDDMYSEQDRLAAAIVNVNIALQRAARIPRGGHVELVADTKVAFNTYEALQAPGDEPFTWRREEFWIRYVESTNPEIQATAEQLRLHLKSNPLRIDPNAAVRYIRDKAKTPPNRNEAAIKERMCPMQVASGASGKYFRFKKTPEEVCPP